jgi:hypothetical protein
MSFGITRRAYLGIRRIVRASFSHYAEKVQWPTWPVLTGRVTAALPVLPLHIAAVPAGGKTVRFPFHRLPDVIRRLLMWPGAFEKMVFEPRKGGQSSELWHGDRWASSPLFSYLQLNGSDGTDFSLGADVEFLDGGELRCGRIISIFRREEPDGSTGELRCVITPYTSDPVLGYHYAQSELLMDWSRRLEVLGSDLHALVEISKCRCHADGLFSDTVLLRSPAGDPVTTVPREEMPGRPFDNIHMTEDFAAFERARAEHPFLKVLTLFVVTSCVSATVCMFVRGIVLVCICIVAYCSFCRYSFTMTSVPTTSTSILTLRAASCELFRVCANQAVRHHAYYFLLLPIIALGFTTRLAVAMSLSGICPGTNRPRMRE